MLGYEAYTAHPIHQLFELRTYPYLHTCLHTCLHRSMPVPISSPMFIRTCLSHCQAHARAHPYAFGQTPKCTRTHLYTHIQRRVTGVQLGDAETKQMVRLSVDEDQRGVVEDVKHHKLPPVHMSVHMSLLMSVPISVPTPTHHTFPSFQTLLLRMSIPACPLLFLSSCLSICILLPYSHYYIGHNYIAVTT